VAYTCPRCNGPVTRAHRSGCLFGGGVVGWLLAAAFAPMTCRQCGDIPSHEFPPEARNRMTMNTVMLVVGAVLLLAVVIGGIVLLNAH
jgi:hypothetical protein